MDYRPRHGRMALRLTVPTAAHVLLPVSNAGATPSGCSGGDQGFQLGKKGGRYTITVRARPPARLGGIRAAFTSVLHGRSGFYGGFVWARRAFNSQKTFNSIL